MGLFSLSIFISIVLIAALAVFVAIPHREVDWEAMEKKARIFSGAHAHQKPLEGTVIVVTGATSGIGLGLTRALIRMGASVVAIGRSASKMDRLVADLPSVTPMLVDQNDLRAVSKLADELQLKYQKIDALINNAGFHEGNSNLFGGAETNDGFDPIFQVNYLSHFLLTEKLSPLLANATNPRLIQVSSSYHYGSDGSDLECVHGRAPAASRPDGLPPILRSQRSYSASKLAQILHARALKKNDNLFENIRVASLCPGWVASDVGRHSGPLAEALVKTLGYPIDGWGISSALVALFDEGDDDFYLNSRTFEFFRGAFDLLPRWSYAYGLRDLVAFVAAMSCMTLQKFGTDTFPAKSSKESYNEVIGDGLYNWSSQAIADFL